MSRLLIFLMLALMFIGCAAGLRIEVRPASIEPRKTAERMIQPSGKQPVFVVTQPLLTKADFTEARVSFDAQGNRAVTLTLSDRAADRLFAYTSRHVGEPLAMLIDDELISAPVVMEAVRNGLMISTDGGLSEAEIRKIIRAVGGK